MADVQANVKKEAVRAPVREATPVLKRGEYRGRDGEVLRREVTTGYNQFDFPDSIKEKGWSYQWCRADVVGSGEFSEISTMLRAGWRHVRPSQLNGYFERECQGADCIEKGGLALMERPEGMTQDAKDEQLREANRHFARQVSKRWGDDTPLPPGVKPLLREIVPDVAEPAESMASMKPGYARVTAPAGDDE